MAEKHFVCQGAICMCKYGATPDKLKVLSHVKEYVNDGQGQNKLQASTKEIGPATFEKNTFGPCKKQNNKPCQIIVTAWTGFYEKYQLMNGGKALIEDSKGTCPIGGPDCITISFHGQTAQITQKQVEQKNEDSMAVLFPLGKLEIKKDVLLSPKNAG